MDPWDAPDDQPSVLPAAVLDGSDELTDEDRARLSADRRFEDYPLREYLTGAEIRHLTFVRWLKDHRRLVFRAEYPAR